MTVRLSWTRARDASSRSWISSQLKTPNNRGNCPCHLSSRVARRANGRHIADPVGPIIAKCRVFITPALAAAERCHGVHSGQDALACSRARAGQSLDVHAAPTAGLALRSGTRPRWVSLFVGGAWKATPLHGTYSSKATYPRKTVRGISRVSRVRSRRPSALAVAAPRIPRGAGTVDWSLPDTGEFR
jgi:hypothetical protein